jgi:hypothetical protein
LAPEVLTAGDGDDGDEVVLAALADVYEFGVVLWELLTRTRPDTGRDRPARHPRQPAPRLGRSRSRR